MQLYTIGHGAHSIDTFISLLDENGISAIVDVRTAPYSRYHPQFNKENLAQELPEVKRNIATIYDINKAKEGRDKLARFGGKLIIASAPGGSKNYTDTKLFLDELESYQGVMPKVLVVDYLRNMGSTAPNQKRKEKISENCLGLVGIGQELGCIVFTAQQGNRLAMKSKVLTPDMIADDIDPVGFADMIPTICQTEAEEKENKARIYLSIVRDAPKGAQIEVVRDLTRGQFHLDSKLIQYEWDRE